MKENKIIAKHYPDIIYLARDRVFNYSKGFDSEEKAEKYITDRGGNGYIEIYKLRSGYYKYKKSKWIGVKCSKSQRGPILGEMLDGTGVSKEMASIILSYKK